MNSVGDYDSIPPWKFGEVLRHTQYPGTLVLFLGWTYAVDYNWHESIFKGLCLTSEDEKLIGTIYEPYCGWYRPLGEVKDA